MSKEREHCEAVAEEWLFGRFLAALTRESEITETADLIQRERAAARRQALCDAADMTSSELEYAVYCAREHKEQP